MNLLLAAFASLALPAAGSASAVCVPVPLADDEYRALWSSGQSFEAFYEAADARRELWERSWATSDSTATPMAERVEAVGGTWYLLAVAVAGCSDSVNTIPYMARLAEAADNLEIRIVDSDAGRSVMEAFPTPDGRGATPTILLLDPDFELRGCFVERPRELRDQLLENPDELDRNELYDFKMGWYAEDRGVATVMETVEMIEVAAAGGMHCAPREG